MLNMRDANGVLRSPATVLARDAGGTLRTLKQLFIRDASGVLRSVLNAQAVTVSPSTVQGTARTSGLATITTAQATASGAATYAWSKASGDASWSIVNPTSASTAFRRTGVESDADYMATFICTGAFADGSTQASPAVSAYVENIGANTTQ